MSELTRKSESRRRRHAIFAIAGLVAVAVAGGGAWWYAGGGGSGVAQTVDSSDPGLVRLGDEIYASYCADCHGGDLEGAPNWRSRRADGTLPAPPHDRSGHTWHHPDGVLLAITRSGGQVFAPEGFRSGMPGFAESLSDREIVASLAFIKSTWPDDIRRRQESITKQSQ